MKQVFKRSSFTIFAMIAATLFSKALGMVRSMIFAWTLGDSAEAVAFAAASKIPSAVFDLLFSAAILGCFIPAYNKAKAENEGAARAYASSFFGAALLVSAVFAVLGTVFAPQIISVSAPKISAENAALAARLLRIMFPMMVFTAGAYTLTGILQSAGNFILPAAISAVSNIFIIAYLLVSGENFSVYTLSFVYVISWFLQFLTLSLPLLAKKQFPRPRVDLKNEYLRASAKNAPHIMAGSWLAPASVLIATFFSSFVSDTTFVIYDYASGIYTIISGIAVYGVGNYVFPSLSRLSANGDSEHFQKAVKNALLSIMLIIIPVFAATFALSYEGVCLLYLRGNFTAELAKSCAGALRTLAPAMPACAVSEILCRTFYAASKAKIPMYSTLFAIFASVACNALSIAFGGGLFGITLSYAAAQWVHALILLFFAKKEFPAMFTKDGAKKSLRLAFCAAAAFASMCAAQAILPNFASFDQTISLLFKITIVFIPGIVIYLLCIYFMGFLRSNSNEKR